MIGPRGAFPLTVVFLLSLAACKRPAGKQPAAQADAGSGAAPVTATTVTAPAAATDLEPPASTETTLRPVAILRGAPQSVVTTDGRVLFATGPMLYEGRRDGSLALVTEASELSGFVPDDEVLSGFLAPMHSITHVSGSLGGALRLTSVSKESKSWFLSSGKIRPAESASAATRTAQLEKHVIGIAPDGQKLVALSEGGIAPAMPAGNVAFDLASTSEGALVAFAKAGTKTNIIVWAKAGAEPRVVPFERPALGGTVNCTFVHPQADGRVTTRCATMAWETGSVKAVYQRLSPTGDAFEKLYDGAPADLSGAAIAKDGTLFTGIPNQLGLMRCPEHGKCEKVAVEKPVAKKDDKTPTYSWNATDAVERDGDRYWTGIRIDTETRETFEYFSGLEIVAARSETDIWMTARYSYETVLFHTNVARDRKRLPSPLDARIIVRNERAPAPWTGHCDHVFVRLDPTAAEARKGELQKILALQTIDDSYYGAPFGWELVEGRLHEDQVTGVIVHRNDVEANLASMEASVERLVTKFATNPMNRPTVTCTLPVITQKLAPFPVSPGG